jgi:hypothetical protein
MTEQQLKDAVTVAQQAFAAAVAAARAEGVTVNMWVTGTGPTNTGPSELSLDFGQ